MSNLGALGLIVDYSDSENDEEIGNTFDTIKFKTSAITIKDNKLPLPDELKNLYRDNSLNPAPVDNPNLHKGRTRAFAHERGNWVTLIYIPYDLEDNDIDMCADMIKICNKIDNFSICDELHISLSRTVILRHHWIDSFINSIKEQLSPIKQFCINYGSLEVYCNDDKSRTFIGLTVFGGYKKLSECVCRVNFCLSEFGLEPFYKDGSFHVSLVWCLGDKREQLLKILPQLQNKYDTYKNTVIDEYQSLSVTGIYCKTGNKIFRINLSN